MFEYDAWVYKCKDRGRPVFDFVVNETTNVYDFYVQNSRLMIQFKNYKFEIIRRVEYRYSDINKKFVPFGSFFMQMKVNLILLKDGNNYI